MKFHDPPSQWRANFDMDSLVREKYLSPTLKVAVMSMALWNTKNRPYYKCWPHIVGQLTKLKLDYTLKQLDMPERTILLRFAEEREPSTDTGKLHVILASVVAMPSTFVVTTEMSHNGKEGFQISAMQARRDETVEEYILSHEMQPEATEDMLQIMRMAFKIAISCHLLADDPDIIEPDVLAADEQKYRQAGDIKYVEKARRRGKTGFHLGRNVESVPHFRTGYFGLRWTGKGGKVPRYVWVRQCLVHRDKTASVPTGWYAQDGSEIEQ